MRISQDVISYIRSMDAKRATAFRLKLAMALGVGEASIRRYIADNSDHLTKAAALAVIREETGLSDDLILESNLVESKG